MFVAIHWWARLSGPMSTKADLTVHLTIDVVQWEAFDSLTTARLQDLFRLALSHTPYKTLLPLEVSLWLTSDQTMQHYNARYRNKDRPTNVLAFPLYTRTEWTQHPVDIPLMLGDIMLGWPLVSQEASEQCIPVQAHITHLLLHGFFHLLHYDHETDEDAALMEPLEIACLATLGLPNPYQRDHDVV